MINFRENLSIGEGRAVDEPFLDDDQEGSDQPTARTVLNVSKSLQNLCEVFAGSVRVKGVQFDNFPGDFAVLFELFQVPLVGFGQIVDLVQLGHHFGLFVRDFLLFVGVGVCVL